MPIPFSTWMGDRLRNWYEALVTWPLFWVIFPFPSDESVMHKKYHAWTLKILTLISQSGVVLATYTYPAFASLEDGVRLPMWQGIKNGCTRNHPP